MSEWERATSRDGKGARYFRSDGVIEAIVLQDGELWRSSVWVNGIEVDRGEWDSRSTALRNAVGAMKRARQLRAPLAYAERCEIEEDEDGEQ